MSAELRRAAVVTALCGLLALGGLLLGVYAEPLLRIAQGR